MSKDPRLHTNKLNRAKNNYCSLPVWLPKIFKDWYEERFWVACKIHDNDRGKKGTIPKELADNYFRYNLINLCNANKLLAWISYLTVKYFHK